MLGKKLVRILGLICKREMFKSANSFPTINDYIAKICYIILGITALINFERCIPPTYAFYFQHIAIMYPLKLSICSIRK